MRNINEKFENRSIIIFCEYFEDSMIKEGVGQGKMNSMRGLAEISNQSESLADELCDFIVMVAKRRLGDMRYRIFDVKIPFEPK